MNKNEKNNGFVCPHCGNDEFHAKQVCYHDVIVNGNGWLLEDKGISESKNPYGTFQCTMCGAEFEELG